MTITVKKASGQARRKAKGGGFKGAIELPEGTWERIRTKAHELWLARGQQEGNDLRDWLDAEEMIMEEIHEARE